MDMVGDGGGVLNVGIGVIGLAASDAVGVTDGEITSDVMGVG